MIARRALLFSLVAFFGISVKLAHAGEKSTALPAPLPAAFNKTVPETLKDLREIEQHVQKLAEKLIPCTVGLRIGGSSGSGVIIDKEGHVLTAGHVSGKPGQDVQILLHDGKKLKGKTLGANRQIDSGMLKITDAGAWPYIEMGALADLKKGHWCMAIGHPNGYQPGRAPVVRLGRVLDIAKNKADDTYTFLRTDCALVGGDSGGPLFDMHGKIIGIHSRIGGPITANIHVPVDTYRETFDKLAASEVWGDTLFGFKKGKAGDAYLGLRAAMDAKQVKVTIIAPDSPAAKAGIKVGDILLSIDGKKIASNEELDAVLRSRQPNSVIALQWRSGAETRSEKIKLITRPDKS
jgi:serine protease Do